MTAALGKVYTPRDMYYGTLLSSAEALHSTRRFTTVAQLVPQHRDRDTTPVEDQRAMRTPGVMRGEPPMASALRKPLTQPFSIAALTPMHGDWKSLSNDGLLTLGIAWRGVQAALPNAGQDQDGDPPAIAGHVPPRIRGGELFQSPSQFGTDMTWFTIALNKLGYVFDGLQVIHAINTSPEEMDIMAKAGPQVISDGLGASHRLRRFTTIRGVPRP